MRALVAEQRLLHHRLRRQDLFRGALEVNLVNPFCVLAVRLD